MKPSLLRSLLLVTGTSTALLAHECQLPSRLETYVGRRVYYTITADVSESRASDYSVFNNSEPGVASVSPLAFSAFQQGLFVFTGNRVGTNFALLHWSYTPNMASGECLVQVAVLPASQAPPLTAANHPQSTHAGDPVNLYTGELILAEPPDLQLGGPMPLAFSRYFASGLKKDGQIVSTLGDNWSHNFNHRLSRLDSEIDIITDRGRLLSFRKTGETWSYLGPASTPFRLVETSSGHTLLDPVEHRLLEFNNAGQLTAIADTRGNRHTLEYDGRVLARVSDGLGRQLTLRYGGHNRLQSVSDGTRTVTFAYGFDALEALIRVVDANGQTHRYNYSGTPATGPLLTSKTLPEGNAPATQTYDTTGRVLLQSEAPGSTNRFEYGPRQTTLTDATGKTRRFEFGTSGELLRATDEAGNTITYTYHPEGNLRSIVDRLGGSTHFTWHPASGHLTALVHPDGTSNVVTYASRRLPQGIDVWEPATTREPDGASESVTRDSLGNPVQRIDPSGGVWTYGFNNYGQVLAKTNALGARVEFEYNPDGTLASITDPGGRRTFTYDTLRRIVSERNADGSSAGFSYDAADRLVRRTNELGGVYTFQRDRNGRVVREVDPMGHATANTYDTANRLVAMADGGGFTRLTYDPRGYLAQLEDPLGHVTRFGYDAVGNMTEVTDPAREVWKRGFGLESRISSISDPLGNTDRFAHDPLGRIVAITNALQGITRSSFDPAGRELSRTTPGAQITRHTYNPAGELLSTRVEPDGPGASFHRDLLGGITNLVDPSGQVWRKEFDSFGRMSSMTDPLGNRRSYTYDSRHRPIHVQFPAGLGELDITFDGLGSITQRRYSDGTDVRYTYDKRGWLTAATGVSLTRNTPGDIVESNGIEIERDSISRVTTLYYAPGVAISYEYDSSQRLSKVVDWMGGTTEYTYDKAGRPVRIRRANGLVSTRDYDAANQLVALTEGSLGRIQVTRGPDGEPLQSVRDLPTAANLSPASASFQPGPGQRVQGFTYDAMGRLLQDSGRSYTWDLASRLTSWSEGNRRVHLEYDAFARRTRRIDGSSTNDLVWNYALRWPCPAILRINGTDTTYVVQDPDGLLLYTVDALTGKRLHHHFDEFGNTVMITDDQQQVVATQSWGPYGELLGSSGTGTAASPFGFQGQFGVMSEAPGLFYMQARYYDAHSTRFLSHEPLPTLVPAALNPYQYAFQNPVTFGDPLGLSPAPLTPKPVAAPASTPPPVHVVTDSEFKREVRIMKNQLWTRLSRSRAGTLDISVPASFDSSYFKLYVNDMFLFRGRVMNGGELNYYFQGMYWKEASGSKGVMLSAIFGWKAFTKVVHGYGGVPSANDLFAACEGFRDTNSFFEELRDDVVTIIEGLVGAPTGAINNLIGSSSPIAPLTNPTGLGTGGGFALPGIGR